MVEDEDKYECDYVDMDDLKWYTDTQRWRKEHGLDSDFFKAYDNIWLDRLFVFGMFMGLIGAVAAYRITWMMYFR